MDTTCLLHLLLGALQQLVTPQIGKGIIPLEAPAVLSGRDEKVFYRMRKLLHHARKLPSIELVFLTGFEA